MLAMTIGYFDCYVYDYDEEEDDGGGDDAEDNIILVLFSNTRKSTNFLQNIYWWSNLSLERDSPHTTSITRCLQYF